MSILYKNIAKAFQARGGFFKLTAGKSFLLKKSIQVPSLINIHFLHWKKHRYGSLFKKSFQPLPNCYYLFDRVITLAWKFNIPYIVIFEGFGKIKPSF